MVSCAEVIFEQDRGAVLTVAMGACRDHLACAAGQLPIDTLTLLASSVLFDDALGRMNGAAGKAEARADPYILLSGRYVVTTSVLTA